MREFLTDTATRHAVFVQRFASGEALNAERMIIQMGEDIAAKLAAEYNLARSERLTALMRTVRAILAATMTEIKAGTIETATEFAGSEAAFTVKMLSQAATVKFLTPAQSLIEAAVLRLGMDAPVGPAQLTLSEMLDQFAGAKSDEVIRIINESILEGRTGQQAAQDVRAIVTTRQARQVGTVTRTVINHVSNRARAATFTENAGFIESYQWVSTLDSRTSFLCQGRDGRVYPVGKGPLPPGHYGCRSTVIPVIKEEFSLFKGDGKRPSVGTDGAELVSAKTTYGQWLKRQPAAFQDEVLGDTRARLFRDGGLQIDRFRDETGRVYTLDQLRALEPLAFERANLTQSVTAGL